MRWLSLVVYPSALQLIHSPRTLVEMEVLWPDMRLLGLPRAKGYGCSSIWSTLPEEASVSKDYLESHILRCCCCCLALKGVKCHLSNTIVVIIFGIFMGRSVSVWLGKLLDISLVSALVATAALPHGILGKLFWCPGKNNPPQMWTAVSKYGCIEVRGSRYKLQIDFWVHQHFTSWSGEWEIRRDAYPIPSGYTMRIPQTEVRCYIDGISTTAWWHTQCHIQASALQDD